MAGLADLLRQLYPESAPQIPSWSLFNQLTRTAPSVTQGWSGAQQPAGYFGATHGGGATVNPMLMAQTQRGLLARLALLQAAGRFQDQTPGVSEGAAPNRHMLGNSPTATWGWALPNVSMPNGYRGQLQPQGALPETMTRDPEQWLRRT